jgi:hypothetical protein
LDILWLTAPSTVELVELEMAKQQVEVSIGNPAGLRFAYLECRRDGVHNHKAERVWGHLDSRQFLACQQSRRQRVPCPEQGGRRATLPWARTVSRFTHLLEVLVIDVPLAANIKVAAAILRIAWNEPWHLMQSAVLPWRAVENAPVPRPIGIHAMAIAGGALYGTRLRPVSHHPACRRCG